jgi:cation:H+ antiporter
VHDAIGSIGRYHGLIEGVEVLIGVILLLGGMALVIWGAERFTDAALRTAAGFALSTFSVGAVVSGFEPENLVTGGAAAIEGLHQVALGTVIGSTVFLLTAGLGLTLLIVPMDVRLPREGPLAMLASLALFVATLADGTVSRADGVVLLLGAVAALASLHLRSPVFQRGADGDDADLATGSRARAVALLLAGIGVMVLGAEAIVHGARAILASVRVSETFLGMVVIGLGESVEETARMVAPARRGHPALAWGNVVGTVVILLALNLGAIALVRPLSADPIVLRLHVPYLAACVVLVAGALLATRRLGRVAGAGLVALYVVYLALNLSGAWG